MHGAGEQQQQHAQQQQRYRYTARNDEQHQQPTTSSQHVARPMHQIQQIQASLMCTPTTTTTTSSASTSSGGSSGGQRSQPSIVRIGKPIKIGNNILEPAGTLVFSQGDGTSWPNGQRVFMHGNKHAVVQANLFPIGGAPVLNMQPQIQVTNGNWYMNQQSATSTSNGSSIVPLNSNPPANNSSSTPDSGIQSVPTSPPSPSYGSIIDREADTIDHEDDEDVDGPADFTDMPLLKPVDEDDDCYDIPSTSAGSLLTEVNTTTITTPPVHSTSTPEPPRDELPNELNDFLTLSIASNMDPDEIVRRLFAFDPEKANSVAMLIKKRCAEESKKKKDMEAEVSSTTPTTPRVRGTRKRNKFTARSTNSPDVTTSNLPEEPSTSSMGLSEETEEVEKVEIKRRGRKPKRRRVIQKEQLEGEESDAKKFKIDSDAQPETTTTPEPACSSRSDPAFTPTVDPVQFRLKVREMMERQLEQLTQKMSADMTELRLSHSTTSKIVSGKRKESFLRQLVDQSKKLKKGGAPLGKRMRMFMTEAEMIDEIEVKPLDMKKEIKEELPPPKMRSRLPSRRARVEDSPEVVLASVEEKFNGEYYEIPKSVHSSDDIIPLWRAPSLTCGCTKGACTSDKNCLNRALRVQCNSDCALSYCSNRRFWKEDCGNKLCVSNGPRTKRVLRTKIARPAGEFLCEYAGEVITTEKARIKFHENQDTRIIAIGSQLFIDATNRANIARFIKHSCQPNSRLEVWSVNGFYRAGVFALVDLSSNVEITVDKSGLLPSDIPCNCGATGCKNVIRGVRRADVVMGDDKEDIKTRRFLTRNRRKTIERARQSGLPAILFSPDDNSSLLLKMKKTLAAFSFRVRRIDGSIPRSMLPYYSSIKTFLKVKSSNLNPAEFVSLFRKWLDEIDDDDLERAFVAIESYYLSSSLLSSAQQSKKTRENAPRPRALSTSCPSPVPSKRGDADLSYLESSYPIGSYDPDHAWEAYRANASDNAVRCICGALDEDGGMVQCDKCHFWLHIDCCEYPVREETGKSKNKTEEKANDTEEKEYMCDFCLGKQTGQRPSADVKLPDQPEVRFENCDYYRSLMNRRGIQVRLNETVYVNRVFPDEHKVMLRNLREEKKGAKHKEPNKYSFPTAPTDPLPAGKTERKEARIFRVERLFICPGNNRFVFGSFYAWPHETYAETGRLFSKKEVFATSYYETLPLDEVIGRCLVVDKTTWGIGRPKVPKFKEDDVFFCDKQIGKNQRVVEKVSSKNSYPINMQPYVFTKFSQPKKPVRDFRPYDPSNPSSKPPKAIATSNAVPPAINPSASIQPSPVPLPEVDMNKLSRKNIQRVLKRLSKKESKRS